MLNNLEGRPEESLQHSGSTAGQLYNDRFGDSEPPRDHPKWGMRRLLQRQH